MILCISQIVVLAFLLLGFGLKLLFQSEAFTFPLVVLVFLVMTGNGFEINAEAAIYNDEVNKVKVNKS